MMLSFAREIKLDPKWQKTYLIGRFFVYLIFLLLVLLALKSALLPSRKFTFESEEINPLGFETPFEKISPGERVINAYSEEKFSSLNFKLISSEKYLDLLKEKIFVRKTFTAFAYPTDSQPASFPNGYLVKNSGNFFLISDGKIKKFLNQKIMADLGYSEDNFLEATKEEIAIHEKGEDIKDTKEYPDYSLFLIDNNYYQLQNRTLRPFVTEKAFLSHYSKELVLQKNKDFLEKYPVNQDESIGFANGTLLSFGDGAFLITDGKAVPFDTPETFLADGYRWEDIIPANGKEIGIYPREKVFNIRQPHPNGVVFYARDTQKYYLISDQKKKEIRGENILKAYLQTNPIEVEEENLNFKNSCQLEKSPWSTNAYRCEIFIENLENNPGKNYQIKITDNSAGKSSEAEAYFSRKINWPNTRDTLSKIKKKLIENYGPAQ